jgi:hypothetical protein
MQRPRPVVRGFWGDRRSELPCTSFRRREFMGFGRVPRRARISPARGLDAEDSRAGEEKRAQPVAMGVMAPSQVPGHDVVEEAPDRFFGFRKGSAVPPTIHIQSHGIRRREPYEPRDALGILGIARPEDDGPEGRLDRTRGLLVFRRPFGRVPVVGQRPTDSSAGLPPSLEERLGGGIPLPIIN